MSTHVNGGYTSYGGKDAVFTSGFPLGVQVDDGTLQYVLTSCTGATTGDKQSGYTIGTTQLLFLIDRENDCAYYFRIDSIGRITIIKRKAWLKGVSLIDNPYKTKPLIEEKVINLTTNLLATSYISYNYDIDDNCLYLVSASSSTIAANKNFVVTKIEFGTWNLTQYTIANTTGVILASSGTRYAFTYKGYVLIRANASPYEIYKIELGNAANVIPIQMIGVSSVSGSFTHAINGRVYIDGYTASAGNWLYVVNLESNEIMKCETYRVNTTSNAICYTPVYNEPLLWFASIGTTSSIGFLMMTNYLATINNLENPVTKTSEKTMKLTYIIQEE